MPTRTTREPKPLSDAVIGFRSHEFRDCRVLSTSTAPWSTPTICTFTHGAGLSLRSALGCSRGAYAGRSAWTDPSREFLAAEAGENAQKRTSGTALQVLQRGRTGVAQPRRGPQRS